MIAATLDQEEAQLLCQMLEQSVAGTDGAIEILESGHPVPGVPLPLELQLEGLPAIRARAVLARRVLAKLQGMNDAPGVARA